MAPSESKESLIIPASNLQPWGWIILIGLPLILLMFVVNKQDALERANPQPIHAEQHAAH